MSFGFVFLVVSFLSFQSELLVTACDYDCQDKPVFNVSEVVVKYGDPFDVKCTAPCGDCTLDLERSVGITSPNGSQISWRVDKMTEWSMSPFCYYNIYDTQCCTVLNVTVYQTPQNVSIHFVNHTGPVKKYDQYTLRCDVLNVAPVHDLRVTFYKGQTALGEHKPNDNSEEPVNISFSQVFNFTKEDNGAELWCEAKLELGLEGPQPPPVVKSGKLTAVVHYGPELEGSSDVKYIDIKRGQTLHLNCSTDGNPPPSYTWMTPFDNLRLHESVFTVDSVDFSHTGQYICNSSNSMDFVVVKFNVTVTFEDIIFIIIGIIAGLFVTSIMLLMVYKSYKQNRMGHYSLKDVFHLKRQHTQIPAK